jgi:peptidoglycan/xylan/chitin deacetylase (PgdA/CDA1 family)
VGQTEIAKWRYGKNGAVSLTYDDGSINQFRVAVPIMDSFGFPATFFIVYRPDSRFAVPWCVHRETYDGDH